MLFIEFQTQKAFTLSFIFLIAFGYFYLSSDLSKADTNLNYGRDIYYTG